MIRSKKLSSELQGSVFGDPWHGASATGVLNEVSFEHAHQKPIITAHSIIELILHLTAWTEEVLSRFIGNKPGLPKMGD